MEPELLFIQPTDHTPCVDFNATTGTLKLSGRSLPENALDFYNPLFTWLDGYLKNAPAETQLHVDLDYFNSISQKMVVEILKNTQRVQSEGKQVRVSWYYDVEDEKMMEEGKAIATEFEIPFELMPKTV